MSTGNPLGSCVRNLEHRFDITSGWCWRCGRIRDDRHRIGPRPNRWLEAVDITQPRRHEDDE